MNGLTDYITHQSWLDTVTTWYVLIEDMYRVVVAAQPQLIRQRGPAPTFSDSEVIVVGLIIETYFHGQEELGYAFVRQYMAAEFPTLLDLDRLNVRRRDLSALMEAMRRQWRDQLVDTSDPVRLVDSAPITLMTYTRGKRCRSVIGAEHFGVVSSKKAKLFGWRIHVTTTVNQVIDDWTLAPAAYVDADVTDDLLADRRDLVLIGDKAFTDAELEDRLWRKRGILLLPLRRVNQHTQWPPEVQRALGRVRHRVETTFSVLSTVYNLQRPRGRSLAGHVARIVTCLLAYTLSFVMT